VEFQHDFGGDMNFVETFRRIYEFGWVAVASAISSAVFNKWSSAVPAADYTYWRMAIDGGGSFLIWLILLSLPFWFVNIPRFRHWLYPHSSIEGWWIQKVDIADRPWSLSHLTKNIGFGWTYAGYAYDAAGNVTANWTSSDIKLDDHAGFWVFKGESHRLNAAGAPVGTGNVLSILYSKQYCEAFETNRNARLPGWITDLDYADQPTAASILLVRVTEEDWKAVGITKEAIMLSSQSFTKLLDHMIRSGKLQA
jgi:hypothetical protein